MSGIASILIVDDNPKILADALPMYGYNVEVDNDGLEERKEFRKNTVVSVAWHVSFIHSVKTRGDKNKISIIWN